VLLSFVQVSATAPTDIRVNAREADALVADDFEA
jgi:hypothetical protein